MPLGDPIKNESCPAEGTVYCPLPGDVPSTGTVINIIGINGVLAQTDPEGNVTIQARIDNSTIGLDINQNLIVKDKGITFAKIQDINSGMVLGRVSPGIGTIEQIPITELVHDNEVDPVAQSRTVTLNQGPGVVITGASTQIVGANPTFTVGHADTSNQGSVSYTGAQVIGAVTLDTYGHITNISPRTLTASDLGAITSETDPVYISQKGQPQGAATLGPDGILSTAQKPAYNTDEVQEGTKLYYLDSRVQAFSDSRYALQSTAIIVVGAGLTGGGDLSASRTIGLDFNYLDDRYLSGYKQKAPARVYTSDNITLSGLQTIDGVSLIAGDRVLRNSTTSPELNGIYVVAAGAWSRATDFDISSPEEISQGAAVFVQEGTLNNKTGWSLSTPDPITVGTTPLTFIQYAGANSYTNGTGLNLVGNQFSAQTTAALWNAASLQGVTVANTAPTNGQLLRHNGTSWAPFTPTYISGNQTITLSGDVTGSGTTTITTTVTAAAVRTKLSQGTGITYNSATGQITNSAPDQIVTLTQGTGVTITGTYPNFTIAAAGTGGTITTVGLNMPATVFGVTNSPLTGTGGTLGVNLVSQSPNTVFAGPSTGVTAAAPAFRPLIAGDIPNLTASKISDFVAAARTSITQGVGIIYNSTTGIITNSAPDQVVSFTNGSGISVTGTYPAFTITNTGAPASGSGNYIQNTASLQATSSFYISAIGRTAGTFQVSKDGLSTYSASINLANAANTRSVNLQLNEDANPGLSTWIHNGTANVKRAEQFANDGRLSIYADNGEGINLIRAVSTVTNATAGIRFNALNVSSAPVSYAQIWGIIESNTAGSENGSLAFNTRTGGSVTEKMRLGFDGLLSKIGTLGNINLAASGAELAFTRSGANFIRATGAAGYLNIVTGGAGLTDAESAITIAASNAVTIRGAVATSSTVSVGSLPASVSGGSFVVANANVLNSRTPTQVAVELATLLPTTGTTNYIQNQNTGVQTGNFNISGSGTVGGVLLASTAAGNGVVTSRSTSTGDAILNADVSGISNTSFRTFRTGGRTGIINNTNEAISIVTTGLVGINNITPQYQLHIAGTSTLGAAIHNTSAISTSTGGFLRLYQTGNPTAVNHRLGGILAGSNPSGPTTRTGAQIDFIASAAWTDGTSHPTDIKILTTGTGEVAPTERMRLTSAGRLGINTDTPATTLHVGGIVTGSSFYSENGSDLPIWAQNGNAMTFAVGTSAPKMYLDDSGNLGIGITPLPARGSILQAEGNVWCTDAYILGSAAASTPIGEFGMDGNVFIRTMGAQNINFRTNASTTRMSIVHSTGNVVFEGQVQIKGGVPGAGKILTSDGTGLATWQTPATVATPTLDQVLTAGNDAINSDIDLIGDNRAVGWWSGSNRRFLFRKEAEPTANFGFYKYDDAGSPALTATITRTTGVWNFGQVPTRAGNTIWDASNHPAGSTFTPTLTGANVLSTLSVNSAGHITALTTRALAASDISAAPASGSGNYIQNQAASAQSATAWINSDYRTNTAFRITKNGSATFLASFQLQNSGLTRGVNLQLNGDTNPGLSTWIHDGTSNVKRFEILATGATTITGTLAALDTTITGTVTATQSPGTGAGRIALAHGTGGGRLEGYGHNGTTWVTGTLTYDASGHTFTSGNVTIENNLQVDGTVTATGGGFDSLLSIKQDIAAMELNALELIKDLDLYEFKYKSNPSHQRYGLVLNDLNDPNYKDVPKEFTGHDGKYVDTYNFMSILAKAIQQLSEKVDNVLGKHNK